jgi:hypothetical protein
MFGWALLLCSAMPRPVLAADALTRQEERLVNYAFATRLGSGVYDLSGRTVQVYRLPFSWTPRPEGPDRLGVRVNMPVTIGFIDFKASDVAATGLPSNLDTASFVPGVEFRLRARENWLIMPHAEVGIAEDRTSAASAYVSGVGIRSVADFAAGRYRLTLGNELLYVRVDPRDHQPADDFASFETCIEARHGMGFSIRGFRADYGLYVSQYLYFGDPHFPLGRDGRASVDDQYEIGVTFGTEQEAKLWKVGLPRLGFGYRFAQGISVFRFVIGIPAPSLER